MTLVHAEEFSYGRCRIAIYWSLQCFFLSSSSAWECLWLLEPKHLLLAHSLASEWQPFLEHLWWEKLPPPPQPTSGRFRHPQLHHKMAFQVVLEGGTPWGFRLQGGHEFEEPLQIAKVSDLMPFFFMKPNAFHKVMYVCFALLFPWICLYHEVYRTWGLDFTYACLFSILSRWAIWVPQVWCLPNFS